MTSVRAFAPLFALLSMGAAALVTTPAAADQVQWRTNVDAARVEAGDTGKLLLLHFYTPSCGPCKVLDNQVFSQPQVDAALAQNFIPVKVNADASPALAGAYRIKRVPTDVVLSPQGAPLASLSCPKEADAYMQQLANFASHYRQTAQQPGAAAGQQVNSAYTGLNIQPPPAPQSASPADATNPYGATRPNYMAGATTPTPGQAQPVYQNQVTGAPAAAAASGATTSSAAAQQAASPQSYQNPYVANAQPAAAPSQGGRYAAAPAANAVASQASQAPQTPPAAAGQEPSASQYAAATQPPITPTQSQQPAVPQVQQTAAVQSVPQLPAGAAPLGLDGYCPVTLRTAGKWMRGEAAIGMEHRGRTYLFASDMERQQFLANPDEYSPVFSGLDPVLMLESGAEVPGARQFGCTFGKQMYLFSSPQTLEKFKQNPTEYAAGVRQAMSRLDGANGGIIRR